MSAITSLESQLKSGLQQLGISLSDSQQQKLLAYLELLRKWNRSFNLTAIRHPDDMVSQLLLDALVALPCLKNGPILDVGTGAGLPGIPLAIARPDLAFTLLDSNGKKVRFINQVKIELQIPNLVVVQSRVELYKAEPGFAMVVSRAYADLLKLVESTSHLLAVDGEWLAWKGELPNTELGAIEDIVRVCEIREVQLPGVALPRHLVRLSRK